MKYLLLFVWLPFCLSGEPTLLLSRPDIDGTDVVFEYGGDLWIASIHALFAQRLTSSEGYETFPEFSPDGKWIAFSGQYSSDNYDVYIMPRTGGMPKRLTFHPAHDVVIGWAPDGEYILFRSARNDWKLSRLYAVSPEGGLPREFPLPSVYEADLSPDGTKLVFNRRAAWLEWKGYRGGRTPDIWLHDLERDTTYKIIDWEGTEIFPQWINGRIYFLSDKDGRMNIYSYDPLTMDIKQITRHAEFDIQNMNKGGTKIVYNYAGGVLLLDCITEEIDTLSILVPDDRRFLHSRHTNVSNLIEDHGISPTGKRAVFTARGEIFTVPREKGPVVNITKTPGIRERYPAWSPDGKWIAFLSEKTGEYEIYIRESRRAGPEMQITDDGDCYRWMPLWSPDSKKLLYADSKNRLFYVDIEKRRPVLIDTSSMSRFSSFSWSPNSRWIAYIKLNDNWFGSIFLYSVDDGRRYRITDAFFDDDDVCFDPSGKYLYFSSSRVFSPIFGFSFEFDVYPRMENICLMTLRKEIPSPFLPESDEEIDRDEKEEEVETENVEIDVEDMDQRIVTIPVPPGNYYNLVAANDKVFYLERIGFDIEKRKYSLCFYDLKEKKNVILLKNIDDYSLSSDTKYIFYKSERVYGILEVTAKEYAIGDGVLQTENMEMKIDREAEINQIFVDAWRLQRDFFYDPGMHGLDWEKTRETFAQFLPYVADRADLTRIIMWMFSELGASHTYVWSSADERNTISVGLLASEFDLDRPSGFYRFKKIYRGEPWQEGRESPLTRPGSSVSEGEFLISIEDELVSYPHTPYAFLENTVGRQIRIRINDSPDTVGAREVLVKPISYSTETRLYYLDWVEKNRKKVEEETNGRVGYIHIPNTSIWGFEEFGKYFFSQAGKEGLIIDVRYNSGGWTPIMFMNYLQRRPLGARVGRTGEADIEPFVKFHENLVCITNEYAGSGGDKFPYYFRELGLGPLIGNRTWGGLLSITAADRRLIDGGRISTPIVRFKDLSGAWAVENEGVTPDIPMDDHPDNVRKGIDPQLEKAIEVIKKNLTNR